MISGGIYYATTHSQALLMNKRRVGVRDGEAKVCDWTCTLVATRELSRMGKVAAILDRRLLS